MEIDFRLVVLLLVLIVHCQCVNIGEGNIHAQTIAPAVITEQGRELFPALTKFYTRFTGWRYIPRANDMIKDTYELNKKTGLTKCLQECHQHNQGGATNCIAVNWCSGQGYIDQSEKCQLETDTPEFIASLRKTYSRCILVSAGLVDGEDAKEDRKWDHITEFHNQ